MLNRRRALLAGSLVGVTLLAAACGSGAKSPSTSGGGSSAQAGGKIGLLLPETQTPRYEKYDKPYFLAAVKAACPSCTVDYYNANSSASQQQSQAQDALTNGDKVLVVDPVDSASAASIAVAAKQHNVPVIAYDRLITGGPIDYYVSFNNVKVGLLQGTALVNKLTQNGTIHTGQIVWINGAPTDNNAKLFKQGATEAMQGKVRVCREYDTPNWSPASAQNEMQQAITACGKNNIVGVYSANDAMGTGAVAAMLAAGFTTIPPLTGQDADLNAIQRILTGQQYMTVYKAIKPEATAAAQLAVGLLRGKHPTEPDSTPNGVGNVPSVLLTPVAVFKNNIKSTVLADGFITKAELCAGQFAAACTAAGI